MEEPWLIKDIAESAASDTVVIIISNKRQRMEIINNMGRLGDRIVDFYSQDQQFAVSDFFGIPHRLMVMSYHDYLKNAKSIIKHIDSSKAFDFPPILIFGRRWRKLPAHPRIIDGDDVTPELVLKMYWEARGLSNKGWRLV